MGHTASTIEFLIQNGRIPRVLGEQNNDPNAAIYKTNYERAHAKRETTKKQ